MLVNKSCKEPTSYWPYIWRLFISFLISYYREEKEKEKNRGKKEEHTKDKRDKEEENEGKEKKENEKWGNLKKYDNNSAANCAVITVILQCGELAQFTLL